jgi:IS30 family transposase
MAYVQLTSEERYLIEHLAQHHISHREIARRLKRHHTTVSRELARNDPVLADASTGIEARTRKPCSAAPCRTLPHHQRRHHHAPLVRYVEHSLRDDRSPDVIAARLKIEAEAWQDIISRGKGWISRVERGLQALEQSVPELGVMDWLKSPI